MAGPYADEDFPADPYPGTVPPTSYVHADGVGHALVRGRVQDEPLDGWLAARGAAPTTGRLPVLAYGSNRNPSKISWLRATLGLGAEPVVVLRVRTRGLAAVWAYGLRTRDGARPAVRDRSVRLLNDPALQPIIDTVQNGVGWPVRP